ncbi:MAG: thioredoxin [Candidatus Odinarchaeota archaeon]|nr:thioredoxin [Candidatus Odinarchaeota archaeon]
MSEDELEKIRIKKMKEYFRILHKKERKVKVLNAPLTLGRSNFDEVIKKYGETILVDFWADWCVPCKIMAPIIEEIARDYAGKVIVGKVNVDENPELAMRYGIMSIPTFIIFKRGKPVERIVGAVGRKHLENLLRKYL